MKLENFDTPIVDNFEIELNGVIFKPTINDGEETGKEFYFDYEIKNAHGHASLGESEIDNHPFDRELLKAIENQITNFIITHYEG